MSKLLLHHQSPPHASSATSLLKTSGVTCCSLACLAALARNSSHAKAQRAQSREGPRGAAHLLFLGERLLPEIIHDPRYSLLEPWSPKVYEEAKSFAAQPQVCQELFLMHRLHRFH